MSQSFERRFTVSVAVERVWSAMTDPAELNEWYFPLRVDEAGGVHTEIDGADRASEVVEFEPNRMFRTRTTMTGSEQWPPVAPATREMTVVLEANEGGTTIVITHSGFGDGIEWEQVLDATKRGVDETIADLVCYLETGVGVCRHPRFGDVFHGIGARETLAGLEVVTVQPDSYAACLGMERGDILVELDGAGVFGFNELNFFCRTHRVGDVAPAAWVRGGRLLRGSAARGPRSAAGVGSAA